MEGTRAKDYRECAQHDRDDRERYAANVPGCAACNKENRYRSEHQQPSPRKLQVGKLRCEVPYPGTDGQEQQQNQWDKGCEPENRSLLERVAPRNDGGKRDRKQHTGDDRCRVEHCIMEGLAATMEKKTVLKAHVRTNGACNFDPTLLICGRDKVEASQCEADRSRAR